MPEIGNRRNWNDSSWTMSKLKSRLRLKLRPRLSSTLLLFPVTMSPSLEHGFPAQIGLLKGSLILYPSLGLRPVTNPHLRQLVQGQ
jgi:hypothetical protein